MKEATTSLPQDFIERIEAIFPAPMLAEILKSFSTISPLAIRINTLTSSLKEIKEILGDNSIPFEDVAWYASALVLPTATTAQIMALPSYGEGKIYIQSLSSMIPALVMNPSREDSVLDIAAAPGSKTTQLADLMHNTGTIIANDISRARMYKLKENLKNYHVKNTTLTYIHGEQIWKKYPELFDETLVDVPCSMEGRFKTNDPETFKDWSSKKVKELAHRQKYLLRSAISATKIGGSIIYSTCTISPEENEEVIDWILEKEAGKIHLEEIHLEGLSGKMDGLTKWKEKTFNATLSKTLRLIPSRIHEGFFVAKIVKTAQTTDLATYL